MNEFIQHLRKHPTASALNLLGLTAALTACYILATQVQFIRNYNRCFPDAENVYRIETDGVLADSRAAWVSRGLLENVAALPEVESASLVGRTEATTFWKNGQEMVEIEGWKVNDATFKCFRPEMICGVDSFSSDRDAILPRSLSMKIFGTEQSVGQHFETSDGERTVVGVFEDFPENATLKNVMYVSIWRENEGDNGNFNYQGYLKLAKGTDAAALAEKMLLPAFGLSEDMDKDVLANYMKNLEGIALHLTPITETYTSGVLPTEDKGNSAMQMILEIACLLLLIVAAINFANFTLAQTPMKIKGINTRKVLGMTNWQLRRGMILETIVVALVAFVLSVALVWLLSLAPWMKESVNGSLEIFDNLHLIIYIGAAALVIGLVVGIYPAWYATSFPPAMVLKGSFGLSPRGILLRKILVGVQLVVAFFLTMFLGVLFLQKDHIYSSDYGFAKDEILFTQHMTRADKFDKWRTLMEAVPGVESVAFVQSMPGVSDLIMRWGRPALEGGRQADFTVIVCDWKFPRTMGIEVVEGRDFGPTDSDCYIFNEKAKQDFPWIGVDKPFSYDDLPVIGFCKNFQLYSKRRASDEDFAMIVFGETYKSWTQPYRIVARVSANVDKLAVKAKLDQILSDNMPAGYPAIEFRFFDDQLQTTYEEEFRFIRQVEGFSLVCLVITLVGVFCLTIFETQYRRREIALRRVLGNTPGDIHRMFLVRYAVLLLPAFALAAPIAWLMAKSWLENFADRTPIHWWILPIAFLAVTITVLSTVALQTHRALRMSPVEAIKM